MSLPLRTLLVPRGDVSPHAGLVLFRGEGGDTVALLISEQPDGATLIVFDCCTLTPGRPPAIAVPGKAPPDEILVLGRIARGVPRGHGEDSQPRPNWYPIGGLIIGGAVN